MADNAVEDGNNNAAAHQAALRQQAHGAAAVVLQRANNNNNNNNNNRTNNRNVAAALNPRIPNLERRLDVGIIHNNLQLDIEPEEIHQEDRMIHETFTNTSGWSEMDTN
ncbi:MAG: hypothetical protein SGILL_010446, partial [Bacillariaceae sp.]